MLRYLQPSFPIAHFHTPMKPSPQSIKPSRVVPVFSLFFPNKLKFLSHPSLNFASKCPSNGDNGSVIRRFCTRSSRGRSGLGSGQEVGAGKSLVDDEADLSDMVSGLRSKDFMKTQLYSDSDNDIDNGRSNADYGKARGTDRVMQGNRDVKRRKDGGFEKLEGRSSRGGRGGLGDRFSSGRGGRNANMRNREDGWDMNERVSEGSRGAGRYGGQVDGLRETRVGDKDSISRFEQDGRGSREIRGGERSDMWSGGVRRGENVSRETRRGERSNMGRGGIRTGEKVNIRIRDFAVSDGEADKDGIRRGERRHMGRGGIRSGEKNNTRRGFALSGDDETEEQKRFKSFKELTGSDEDEDDETYEEDGDLANKEGVMAHMEDGGKTSPPSSSSSGDSYLTETRFDHFSVSPLSMKGLKDAGFEKMTLVQEATLPVILKGKDVLAKARTGTGKTVAFLLPSIEVVEKTPAASRDEKRPPILVLIVCPTRELACQAASEANKLLKYHPSLGVQVVIGGTRLSLEQKRMQANPCQIIVATPGRLKDHIENTAGFATRLTGIKVLVLDEADHLLDMGFRKDIERIIAAVPKQRQTLLFSATIPPEVRQICHIALKRDYEYVNTVQEGSEETHTQVRQTHLVATLDNHFPLLYTLLKDHIADNVDYKVLVFCTTAMVTRLIAELLGELSLNVREIHSRKSQSYRTKVSDEFRKSKGLILVTSDVSARGVDYPDVTLVVQLGLPADKQQYIHRLGRTGRKGKEGEGVLLLASWEEFFLSTIKDIPITKAPTPLVDPESRKKVELSMSRIGMKEKESAYQAWLGYYNSNKTVGKDKSRLVELANEFSRTMGLDEPPAISKMVLGKMGLKNVPGLRSK